jgi:hypothetical protein
MTKTLTSDQLATLKSLRREVDDAQDACRGTREVPKDANIRLHMAREKLRAYTSDLRKEGYTI